MPPKATVVIPTFDHGPLLLHSARSALAQTVEDIEVFIVGDGVPDVTREVVAELERDDRVRFFDNPKAPSRGETHRNAVLKEARGEIVCYLSDDDLWLPEHVETLRGLLAHADFAHSLPTYINGEGEVGVYAVDLAHDYYRGLLLSGTNRVPLSSGAHTLEMYLRLPHGWRTTPKGTPTDLYMWQQFLADPQCRLVSDARPTVLNFPTPLRRDWPPEERLDELASWGTRIGDAEWRERFVLEVLDAAVRARAEETIRLQEDISHLQIERRAYEQQAEEMRNTQQQAVGRLRLAYSGQAETMSKTLANERRKTRTLELRVGELEAKIQRLRRPIEVFTLLGVKAYRAWTRGGRRWPAKREAPRSAQRRWWRRISGGS